MLMMRRWAAAAFLAMVATSAHAASSPFGIATPDGGGAIGWGGPLRGFFIWIALEQSNFYRALTGALSGLAERPHAALFLIGISFLYGVFHAVGPGHGKAVISSYLIATGDTLRRGIIISFGSGLAQGITAILVVMIGTTVLRVTAVTMTHATDALETASFAAIALCGAWLLWLKTFGRRPEANDASHVHDASCAVNGHGRFGLATGPRLAGSGGAARLAFNATPVAAPRAASFACDCGHAHSPDPSTLTKPLTLKSAWAAMLAVGIRPCSGAIIVLVFALSQHLWWAGTLSVAAMSLGTGLTVALLATLAVKARGLARRLASRSPSPMMAHFLRGLEIAAAAGVLLFGLAMLGGALVAGG